MQSRAAAVKADHHVLIDGTLKSDESEVNTPSNFSRKAKTKGTRDISVLYAFDLEELEPVCSSCYPGNMLDPTANDHYLKQNQIVKDLLVVDKGLPLSKSAQLFKDNKDLHFLSLLKRNSKLTNKGILEDREGITYRKVKVSSGHYLYSFRNSSTASKEEKDYLSGEMKREHTLMMPSRGWKLVKMNPSQFDALKIIGLLPKDPEMPKRRRGRPRKIAI